MFRSSNNEGFCSAISLANVFRPPTDERNKSRCRSRRSFELSPSILKKVLRGTDDRSTPHVKTCFNVITGSRFGNKRRSDVCELLEASLPPVCSRASIRVFGSNLRRVNTLETKISGFGQITPTASPGCHLGRISKVSFWVNFKSRRMTCLTASGVVIYSAFTISAFIGFDTELPVKLDGEQTEETLLLVIRLSRRFSQVSTYLTTAKHDSGFAGLFVCCSSSWSELNSHTPPNDWIYAGGFHPTSLESSRSKSAL
mmetsp:Transcript_16085/g.27702  ORF Transcript_16085/g.27702 Transcript_16085/m.27702 type:complete len:256 (-) Transcript_16085:1876-2643(-)